VRALVTDAHLRSTLHGIRALGRAHIETVAVADSWKASGLWSRHAAARAVVPPTASERFAGAVAEVAERHGPLVVLPGREAALDALVHRDSDLPAGCLLASPGPEALERVRSKPALADIAARAGLRTPPTLLVGSARQAREAQLPVPCVVKPARPGQALCRAHVVTSSSQLATLLGELLDDEPLLIQEHVAGALLALSVVVDRAGSVVARFQQVAARTFPPEAGVSSLAISVAPDETLTERVGEMLRQAGFWGMAQLQFLAGEGWPVLIDVNPRFYGSLSLALAAGVNLPAAWHAVARGAPVGPAQPYRLGVRYRWLEADIVVAARGGDAPLLPARRPVVGAWWSADDPLPAAILAGGAFSARIRRQVRRRLR